MKATQLFLPLVILIFGTWLLNVLSYFEISTNIRAYKTEQKIFEERIKETTTAKEHDCSMWEFPKLFGATYDPLIKLDRDLYLYPGLRGGLNNQIKGFYQSIYLAIRLNR